VKDYLAAIEGAGFAEASLTPVYLSPETIDEAAAQLGDELDLKAIPEATLYKTVFSAKVTAKKPS
jgi:hypothetical protein